MELIFVFRNISTNNFLEFTDPKENIRDFILTKKGEYPFEENYFLGKIEHFKDTLPDFENEILQTINTTDQATIDTYFAQLIDHVNYIRTKVSLEEIKRSVQEWNKESLKSFEELVEKETANYFNSDERKRKHLEEFEATDFGFSAFGLGQTKTSKKIKKINHNYYCIEKQPELIDETYCKDYYNFIVELGNKYLEIANRYGKAHQKGEIVSKVGQIIFNKPVVFVEGEYDIMYINKAAELLNKKELLNKIELRQRGGFGNLDKIWDVYKENNWETVSQKKLLLYDCDIKKADDQRGNVYKRVITIFPENIISKGIENLFPNTIIEKAISQKKSFVDITKVDRIKRGVISNETTHIVNEEEKKNLCLWICENGTAEDFSNFGMVFNLISIVT
jgi:hypothetical protein